MSKFKKRTKRFFLLSLMIGFLVPMTTAYAAPAAPAAPKIEYVTYLPYSGKVEVKLAVDPLIPVSLKGYSIVADGNASTIPNNTIDTIHPLYEMSTSFTQDFFIHVASVDQQDKKATTHHKVIIPKLTIKGTPTGWTNGNVTLNITGSGFDKIITPDGTMIAGTSAAYTAKENGGYSFLGINSKGEKVVMESYIVDNIDRVKKDADVTPNDKAWKNKDVKIEINTEK